MLSTSFELNHPLRHAISSRHATFRPWTFSMVWTNEEASCSFHAFQYLTKQNRALVTEHSGHLAQGTFGLASKSLTRHELKVWLFFCQFDDSVIIKIQPSDSIIGFRLYWFFFNRNRLHIGIKFYNAKSFRIFNLITEYSRTTLFIAACWRIGVNPCP